MYVYVCGCVTVCVLVCALCVNVYVGMCIFHRTCKSSF